MSTAIAEISSSAGLELVRFRLDVQEPGGPFVPRSFHPTHAEAFDAGLLIVTGQTAEALAAFPGWDFAIRDGEAS